MKFNKFREWRDGMNESVETLNNSLSETEQKTDAEKDQQAEQPTPDARVLIFPREQPPTEPLKETACQTQQIPPCLASLPPTGVYCPQGQAICKTPCYMLPYYLGMAAAQSRPIIPEQNPLTPAGPPYPAKPAESAKPKSVLGRIISLLSNILSVALILIAVFAAYSFLTGDREYGVAIGTFRLFNVITASMEPTINAGSVIVTMEPKEYELKRGDIVTFVLTEESESLVTHRITQVGPEQGVYTTRGDANRVDDPPIHFENIIGKHVFTIPLLGIVMSSLSSPISAVWLISIVMLFILLFWIVKKIFQEERQKGGAPE
ncbi:MAG: signal peptidase I [Clostridiales bacterium]|jgi:signal peptidase I|nr:signal peptidase I [Clostridiales bacterium]